MTLTMPSKEVIDSYIEILSKRDDVRDVHVRYSPVETSHPESVLWVGDTFRSIVRVLSYSPLYTHVFWRVPLVEPTEAYVVVTVRRDVLLPIPCPETEDNE